MPTVLSTAVDTFDGVTQFSARAAVIELDDNNTFTLTKIDRQTGVPVEVVFDHIPVGQLTVRGSSSTPVFLYNGVKKRVDFSFGSRAAMGFGAVGMIVAGSLLKKSGVNEWMAALKAGGATVKYRSFGKTLRLAFIIAGALVVVIVGATVIGVLAGGGN
jgi:hypothetical protein